LSEQTSIASDLAAAPPEDTAESLFRALGRLHADGALRLRLDFKRLDHIDCPVGIEADANRWAYAVLAATLLAFWFGGWKVALVIAALGILAYYTLGRNHVRRRLRRRVEDGALTNLDLWRKLWRWGGIALVPVGGGAECVAPDGNWMALVRSPDGETPARPSPGFAADKKIGP
jgi:hypothetical protein